MGGASRSAEGLPLPDPGGPLCARLQPGGGRLRPRGAAHRSRRHSEPGIAPPAQPPPRSPAGKRRPRDRHCAREHKPAHAAPGIRSRLGLALHAGAVPPRTCRGRALRRNGEDGRGLDRGYAVREGRADHSPSRPGSGRPQGPPFRPALRAPRPAPPRGSLRLTGRRPAVAVPRAPEIVSGVRGRAGVPGGRTGFQPPRGSSAPPCRLGALAPLPTKSPNAANRHGGPTRTPATRGLAPAAHDAPLREQQAGLVAVRR